MRKSIWLLVPMLVGAVILTRPGISPESSKRPAPPRPTEHILDFDAERKHKTDRKAWFESMHRTAPGVDWRAIERENGRQLQETRNRTALERGKVATGQWSERGSRNLAGRMHCATLSAAGDSLIAGSSLGGVWKADLSGNGWRPLSDNLWGGTHGVAVAASPVETITAITDGGEIHYSTDDGATWIVPAGLPASMSECKRIVRDPASPGRIYLALRQSSSSGKVYVSNDGGASYTRIFRLTADQGDIWIDRVAGGDIYVQKGLQTFRSSDQGATWDTLGTIPAGSASGIILAGSEGGSPTLYAAVNNGGWELYRSTDGGNSWGYRNDINDFWETLEASITDPDIVVFGGVECFRSTNGGGNFTKVNGWAEYYNDIVNKLHADLPGMNVVWSGSGEIWYIATDGGLYRSDDKVATVTNISLEYLGVSQYYTTLTSVNDPALILAGAQDQGFQRTNGSFVGALLDFDQLISGDYAHLTSSTGTDSRVWSVYPGFVLVTEGASTVGYPDFPAGQGYPATPWLPFILANPDDEQEMFFCGTKLFKYRKIGPGYTISEYTTHDFTTAGASLTALAISPVNHTRWYAAMNSGARWYSTDTGATWTLSSGTNPPSHYLYGTGIAASLTDVDVAYLGGSGYSNPPVWRTTDGGGSWQDVSTGLPSTMVYEVALEGTGSGVLYAATEAGPYQFDPVGETWSYIGGSEAPLTTYWCVEAVPAANVMRFGTYGRGIWDFDYTVATDVASGGVPAPSGLAILGAPNPFNPSTAIRFELPRGGRVSLTIYETATGREVRRLADARFPAGTHEIVWDGKDDRGIDVSSGSYSARIESGPLTETTRLVLIR